MTNTMTTEQFLEHYGVKGMQWGVRRQQKKLAKADKKWQKNIYSLNGAIDVHNNVADKMNNGGLDRLNNSPKFKDADLSYPDRPATKAYIKAYEKLTEEFTAAAIREVHGTSPSGSMRATLDTSGDTWKVVVENVDLQHAATENKLVFELDHDEKGFITSMAMVDKDMKMSDPVLDFLEHFGVKGMQWGVRNRDGGPTNRELNKQSRAKDKEARIKEIDAARKKMNSGKSDYELKKAEYDYAANKAKYGSREARKILYEAREKYAEEYATATQVRDGKEAAIAALLVGGALVVNILAAKQNS